MIFKLLSFLLLLLTLNGCDMVWFNETFRNPYTVDIGKNTNLKSGKWHTFEKNLKAINRTQVVKVKFENGEWSRHSMVNLGENECGWPKIGLQPDSPTDPVIIDLLAVDSEGNEVPLCLSGLTYYELIFSTPFSVRSELTGKTFTKIKIRSNTELQHVELKWLSRTGGLL